MVRQIAVFPERCNEIHRGAWLSYGETDHRIGLSDVPQVGLRHKETAVALSCQLHGRWDITGFQPHNGGKI